MAELTADRRKALEGPDTGRCSLMTGQFLVSASPKTPYTYDDIAAIQDEYFGGKGNLNVHMNGENPGTICIQSFGDLENAKFVKRIRATCNEKVMKDEAGKVKCDALIEGIGSHIAQPPFFSIEGLKENGLAVIKWIGLSVGGLVGVVVAFGPAIRNYNKWADKKDAEREEKKNKKDPPDGPTGGTPSEASEKAAAAEAKGTEVARSALPESVRNSLRRPIAIPEINIVTEPSWTSRIRWDEGLKMAGWGAATVATAVLTYAAGAATVVTAFDPIPGDEVVLGMATAAAGVRTAASGAAFLISARMFVGSIL